MAKKQPLKNRYAWTWRMLRDWVKRARVGDEAGFSIGRKHFILIRDDDKLQIIVRVRPQKKTK